MKQISTLVSLLLFVALPLPCTPLSVPSGRSVIGTRASKGAHPSTTFSGPEPVNDRNFHGKAVRVGSPSGAPFIGTDIAGSATLTHTVVAHDAYGNVSAQSASVDTTTAANHMLMSDDFETQDTAAWTNPMRVSANGGIIVQSANVHSGAWALQSMLSVDGVTSSFAYITHNFAPQGVGVPLIYARTFFRIDPNWIQTASSGSKYDLQILQVVCTTGADRVLIRNTGTSGSPNFVLRDYLTTSNGGLGTTSITVGLWHEVELMVSAGRGNGQTTTWLDGVQQTNQTGLTVANPFQLRLGLSTTDVDSTGSFQFDDVMISTAPMGNATAGITVRRPNTAARAGFTADVTLFGQTSTDVLTATISSMAGGFVRTVFTHTGPKGRVRIPVSMRELDKGDYTFAVVLADQFGNTKAVSVDSFRKYMSGVPPVSVDEYNNISVNGSPAFMVTPHMEDSLDLPKWIPSVANYVGWNGGYSTSYSPAEWIDFLRRAGVPGFMGELRIGPITKWTNSQGSRGMNCSGAFLNRGGSGYRPGDTFTIDGGKPGALSVGIIQSVDGNGAAITFAVDGGAGYSATTGMTTTTRSGSGSGLLIDIASVNASGSLYSPNQGVPPCLTINQPEAPAVIAKYASTVGTDPYTLGYALMDEPDSGGAPGRVTAATLGALLDEWHANDANSHPVWLNLYAGFPLDSRLWGYLYPPVPHNRMVADIYAFDYYPFIYGIAYPGFRVAYSGRDPVTNVPLFVRGRGYKVGDTFTIDGGTTLALGQVIDVMPDGSGGVRNMKLLSFGSGYTAGMDLETTAVTGRGSGFRVNIKTVRTGGAISLPGAVVFPDGSSVLTVAAWVRLEEEFQKLTYGLVPWFNYVNIGIQESGSTTGTGETKDEMRMICWLSIIHGGKGISWWGPEGWTIPDDWDEAAKFKSTAVALRAIILSPSSSYTVTNNATLPGSRVDFMVREDANNIWILAQRLTDSIADPMEGLALPLLTTFTISGLPSSVTRASVYGESRTVPVSSGVLTDNFAPYATHFYVIPKTTTAANKIQLNGIAADQVTYKNK